MEALWNLEDKWKLSTQQAFILFTCTAVAVVGLCAAAWMKSRKAQKKEPRTRSGEINEGKWGEEKCGWVSVKRVLVGSVRWSKAKKWEEKRGSERWGEETPERLLGGEGEEFGSQNSTSAVWQRPILMGEKCELPKYSGLILYDERGRLLHDEIAAMENGHQLLLQKEGTAIVVKTRLKDLL